MITAEDRREVAAQLPDFGVADIGVEDLFQHGQLLRSNQLLIIKETPIFDDGRADHVLDLAEYLAANFGGFHAKITSRCLHWKCTYLNVALFSRPRETVDFAWKREDGLCRGLFSGLQFRPPLLGEIAFAESLFKTFISVVSE
ncbi:MAG: hypothetical protein JSW27_12100 [Phycisphaerales bacterium]|nr:MAG: hypothetical protein JSW27_12100 [Phycisphaerales bacterium]